MYAPFGAGILVGPRRASPKVTRSSPAAAPSISSTSTRSPGPIRPSAKRPAHPTSLAPSHSTPRSTSCNGSAGTPSSPTISSSAARLRADSPRSTASRCSARVATSPCCRWRRSPSQACITPSWPPGSSVEHGIGVRHGCFCAHPYLLRLLNLTSRQIADYHAAVRAGDRRATPGAVRASAGLSTSTADIDLFLAAVAHIAAGEPAPFDYDQDPHTGDFWPLGDVPGWTATDRAVGASRARG